MTGSIELDAGLSELATGHHILEMEGHGDLTLGHLSWRDPDGRGFWMKVQGLGLGEVRSLTDFLLLDFDGEVLWTKDTGTFNTMQAMATASSPALHEDRLYVLNDNTTRSFLPALATATGEEIWRVDRQEGGQTWATPLVWENRLRTEIVTAASSRVRSYDLDGALLWELGGMSLLTTPSPFTSHGLVYISSGYPGGALRPVYAIQPGAAGDISVYQEVASGLQEGFPGTRAYSQDDHVVWSYPLLGTYNTTALVYGDIYYTLLDRGFLTAHDAATGEEIYGRRRLEIGNGFTASPWGYNGKIFLLSEDGDSCVV